MPQIAQIAATYSSQIFWLLIVFGLIYFGIGRGLLPKIEATVEGRDRKIADDLAAAEAARKAADSTEEAYTAKIDEARTEALRTTKAAKDAATLDAEARVKTADAELAARAAEAEARLAGAQSAAMAEIEAVAAEAAQEIVSRVSGVTVDRDAAARAVKAALASA